VTQTAAQKQVVRALLERHGTTFAEEIGIKLGRLRDAAERNPARERELLTGFKGIGNVGADIFLREAQRAWSELRPYFDERALASARKLDLPDDPAELARLAPRGDTARLAAALVRAGTGKDHRSIRADAGA